MLKSFDVILLHLGSPCIDPIRTKTPFLKAMANLAAAFKRAAKLNFGKCILHSVFQLK